MDWDALFDEQIARRTIEERESDYLICNQQFFEGLDAASLIDHTYKGEFDNSFPYIKGMRIMIFEYLEKPNIMSSDEFDVFCQELFRKL